MDLIGKTVQWEKAGRGRGEIATGRVVQYIPAGTSNEAALETLKAQMPELRVRRKYCRFQMSSHSTNRVFVLVEQETKRTRTLYWIYAPNVLEVEPV